MQMTGHREERRARKGADIKERERGKKKNDETPAEIANATFIETP